MSPSRSTSIPFSEYTGDAGSVRVPSVQVSSTRMSARRGRTAAHKQASNEVFCDQERIKCGRPVLTIMEEFYGVVVNRSQRNSSSFNRAVIQCIQLCIAATRTITDASLMSFREEQRRDRTALESLPILYS